MSINYITQDSLLLNDLMRYYENEENMKKMVNIITGESKISLRIIDWFVCNYSKKYYTNYIINRDDEIIRFKVYIDYKLKLKAYTKRKLDCFCRWARTTLPYRNKFIETTIGQLNFFKWAIQNKIIDYIENHYEEIEKDMLQRNSLSKKKDNNQLDNITKTRKKRSELSFSATKTIKKENIEVILTFMT